MDFDSVSESIFGGHATINGSPRVLTSRKFTGILELTDEVSLEVVNEVTDLKTSEVFSFKSDTQVRLNDSSVVESLVDTSSQSHEGLDVFSTELDGDISLGEEGTDSREEEDFLEGHFRCCYVLVCLVL